MYCAYVTRIHNLRKHTNADRLLCGECFGNTVIVDLGTDPDQLGVYFPTDGKLGLEFAQKNDLLRRKDENGAPAGGYLDPEKRNIKALKLRGEKSDGLFLPLSCLASFTDIKKLQEGDTISVLNGTPFEATEAILSREELHGSILEPAAGEGHISKVLREHYPNSQIISTDLVQRDDRFGCGIVGGVDFLTENYPEKFNNVITNPPFSLAKEFAEKALEVSTGKVILFAKIQFLEGRQRKDFFATHPPKAVYVFSKRVNPLRNGLEVDENGKPWSSTMCFAWFVWEHGYTGEPCIRWI